VAQEIDKPVTAAAIRRAHAALIRSVEPHGPIVLILPDVPARVFDAVASILTAAEEMTGHDIGGEG
jgi:hypothetical protein